MREILTGANVKMHTLVLCNQLSRNANSAIKQQANDLDSGHGCWSLVFDWIIMDAINNLLLAASEFTGFSIDKV